MTSTFSPALSQLLARVDEPAGGVRTDDVDYQVAGTACRGYLARPAVASGPLPAVLVLADWLGVGDYVRVRAQMLARLGYVAFCADVYGVDTRPGPQEAPAVAGAFYADLPLWRERLVGAWEHLLGLEGVDATRTAAIGYCFGGSGALQLARTGADARLVVCVHGGLSTGPAGEAAAIRARLLVLTGGADPVVPDAAVHALQDELRAVPTIDWEVVTYAGAMHAFTLPEANSPEHGAQYHPVAERRSWRAMRDALDDAFAG